MVNPKRKARKKAAREAAGKKVEEHIKSGSSRIKEMADAELDAEKKLAATMDYRKSKSRASNNASYEDVRNQQVYSTGDAGAGMSHAGRVNAMNRYEGRGGGAPVAGGTKKQVNSSQKENLKNIKGSKQAKASAKRSFKKKY